MPSEPIKVFISYSWVDEIWKTKLVTHMGQARREKLGPDEALIAGTTTL